jgi:hypothetical protein
LKTLERVVMSCQLRWLVWSGALALVLAVLPAAVTTQGNPDRFGFKFNSGQDVQPIFEGWASNPDGSFAMYFGYLNRNYIETMEVPVGPDNKFEPGVADRGQPTFFNTRIHRKAFSVTVPRDWGTTRELVWSLTVHGTTERAVAWLQREWEIDPVYGGRTRTAESLKNKPPTMTIDALSTITLPDTLTLAANVNDDGLPKPRGPRQPAVGQETPPTLKPLPDQPEIPVNVPSIGTGGRGRGRGGPQGLVVAWVVWRGPAAVEFAPASVEVKDGKAVTTATFTKPGNYLLRGVANDGELTDQKDVSVRVNAPSNRF